MIYGINHNCLLFFPIMVTKNVDVSFHNVNKMNNLTGQDAKIKNHPLLFYRGGNHLLVRFIVKILNKSQILQVEKYYSKHKINVEKILTLFIHVNILA